MNIALFGYGKMGKTIEALARSQNHNVVFARTSGGASGSLGLADVAIEFSSPGAALKNCTDAINHNIPLVCGTTGWLEHYGTIVSLCKKRNGSFIYASNFSIGANLFFHLNAHAAKLMAKWEGYRVSIEETHHTQKQDMPSGTAITLAEQLIEHTPKTHWSLENGTASTIKITPKRKGDAKGTHSVKYESDVESIALTHTARSREGFAQGALLAAEWLRNKKGVYTMKDVLGIT